MNLDIRLSCLFYNNALPGAEDSKSLLLQLRIHNGTPKNSLKKAELTILMQCLTVWSEILAIKSQFPHHQAIIFQPGASQE